MVRFYCSEIERIQRLTDKEVKERADVTVKLANVTGESTETISEQLTAVWNNFYDGSKSLEYYADVMTKLGAATASSSEEISQGLEKFAAVADTVGLSYEYAASALATVTATTRESADVVGTAFKTLFSRIQGLNLGETQDDGTTLNKYSQALASVGVSVKDAAGNLRDMDDILNSLGSKWGTLAKTQQVALAQTIGGARQYSNFIALMDNWGYFQENLTTAMGSTGALQEQADIYAESWEAAQMRVKASAQAIYSDLIDDEFFIKLLNGVDKVLEGVDKLIGSLGGLKGVLSSISVIVLSLGKNSLVKSLDAAIYNVGMLTESGRKRVLEDKNRQTADAISQLKVADSGDVEETERLKGNFMHEAELQNAAQVASATASDSALMIIKSNLETVQQLSQQAQEAVKASRENRTATEEYLRKLVGIRKEVTPGERGEVNEHISAYASALQRSNVLYSEGNHAWTTLQDYKNDKDKRLQVFDEMALGSGLEAGDKKELREALTTSYDQFEAKLAELDAQAIENLNQKHQQIVDDLNKYHKKDKAENKAEDLNEFESDNTNAAADMDVVRVQAAYQKAVDGTAESIDKAAKKNKEWSEIIVETATLMMGAMSVYKGITGIIDAIKDDDLSGWEKFTSILTSLAFTLPMLVNSWKSLKTAISKETLEKIANTIATKANTAEQKKNNAEKAAGIALSGGSTEQGGGSALKSFAVSKAKGFGQGAKGLWEKATSGWNSGAWSAADDAKKSEYIWASLTDAEKGKYLDSKKLWDSPNQWKKSLSKQQLGEFYTNPKGTGTGAMTNAGKEAYNKWKQEQEAAHLADAQSQAYTELGKDPSAIQRGSKLAGKDAFKAGLSKAGGAALIAAGVTVAVLAVKGLKAAYDKANTAAAEAAEYANSLANAYQNVKTAYTDLKNTAESWTEKDTALDSLQVGTTEWKEALIEANEEALKLIDTYDNLKYEVDSTGRIKIDKDSLETVQDQELKKVEKAQGNAALAKANALEAEIEADRKNFNRKYSSADTADAVGQFAGYGAAGGATGAVSGALVGAGIGLFLGPAGAAIGAVIGSAIGSAVGAISGEVVAANTGQESAKEQAIVENLVDKYMAQNDGDAWMETSEDFAQAAKELGLTTEDEIDALKDLVKETAANTEQLKLQNGIAGAQKGEEYIEKYGTVAEKAAWNKLTEAEKQVVGGNLLDSEELKDRVYELTHVGGEYDEGASTFWHPFKTKTDKEVHEQYAQDVLGWDLDDANIIYENRNGKGYFKNSDTGEEYELDDTEMRQALAYNQAYNELFGKNITADALKGISDLRTAGYDAAIAAGLDKSSTSAVGNALTAGKEDLAKEVATLSAEERQALIDLYNDPTALKDIDYTGLGYETFEEYMLDLGKAINAWDAESAAKAVAKRRQEEYETALATGVETLEVTEEALSYYADSLAKTNGYLKEGTAAAVEYATAQAGLRKNLSALSSTIGENIDVLSNGNKDSLAYAESLGEVAGALGDLFGVTPDTAFVEKYFDEIVELAHTGKGAEKLREALAEDWLVNESDIEDATDRALMRKAATAASNLNLEGGQTANVGGITAFDKDNLEAFIAEDSGNETKVIDYFKALGLQLNIIDGQIQSVTKLVDDDNFVTTAQELLDELDDISDRYHEINRQLSVYERKLDNISKKTSNAFGAARLGYYDAEIDQLETLIALEKQRAEEAAGYVQEDYDDLQYWISLGLKIDEVTGEVLNYREIFRSLGSQEEKNDLSSKVSQYEDSLDAWREAVDAAADYEQEQLDKKWEKLNYEVEFKLEISDADQKYLDLLLSLADDPLKDAASNIETFTQKLTTAMDSLSAYDNTLSEIFGAGTLGGLNSLSDVENTLSKIESYISNPSTLDENSIEALQDYRDTLYEVIEMMSTYVDTIKDYVVAAMEEMNEQFDKQTSKLEHYNKVLESYKNIIDLTGKSKLGISDQAYIELLQAQQNNANAQVAANKEIYDANKANLDALNAEQEEHSDSWSEEAKEAWQEAIDEAEKNVFEAEEALQESWANALEVAAEVFENTVNTVVDSFEKSMTGVYGTFDKLQEAYDQQSTLNSRYVADYEKIYNLSKLNRNIQNSIDNTSNTKAKKTLLSLQKQINELNESDAEISQYQLDYLQKQYDLKLAQITLEEAQNAKSQVRMKRDSEGNYAYVFTASADEVSKAEQNYEDALYSAQKLTQDYIEENSAALIQIQKEYAEAMRNIRAEDYATQDEYLAALQRTTDYYSEMMEYRGGELELAIGNAKDLYENDWADYSEKTGYKLSANKDWVDSFDELNPALKGKYDSIEDITSTWTSNMNKLTKSMKKAYLQYEQSVKDVFKSAGTTLDNFQRDYEEDVKNINSETELIINKLKALSSAATSTFANVAGAAAGSYDYFSDNVDKYIEKIGALISKINEAIAAAAELEGIDTSDGGNTPPITSSKYDIEGQYYDETDGEFYDELLSLTKAQLAKLKRNSGLTYEYTDSSGVLHQFDDDDVYNAFKAAGLLDLWTDRSSYSSSSGHGSPSEGGILYRPDGTPVLETPSYSYGGTVDVDKWKSERWKVSGYYGATAYAKANPSALEKDSLSQYHIKDGTPIALTGNENGDWVELDDGYWINKSTLVAYHTGGYTGDWSGTEGRLALLHQKEIVLNQDDTANLLSTVDMVRNIARIIDLNAASSANALGTLTASLGSTGAQTIEQKVEITASFPNATNHSEIEQAFTTLINEATQFANRKKI